jgi:hypothetical protein
MSRHDICAECVAMALHLDHVGWNTLAPVEPDGK